MCGHGAQGHGLEFAVSDLWLDSIVLKVLLNINYFMILWSDDFTLISKNKKILNDQDSLG